MLGGCGGPEQPGTEPLPTEEPSEIAVSDEVRVARLSHTQWENSVRDLLGLEQPLGLSGAFVKDATKGEFDNEDASLGIDQVLFQQYQDAAWVVADTVIQDQEVYRRVVGEPLGAEVPEAFIRRFGRRVHREPLTDAQVAQYASAWTAGVAEGSGPHPEREGLRQLLAAFFQSPWFLYRVEDRGEVQDGQLVVSVDGQDRRVPIVHVSPHDLAARLSYSLWNTVPDPELDAAADDGSLRDEAVLRAQAERMLLDPRAAAMVEDLHDQLLKVDLYINVAPDTVLFPDYDLDTIPAMQAEVRAFVDEVVRTGGGLRELFLSRRTFVNPLTAEVYGIEGVPDDGQLHPVDLDPGERAGLLTLSGFLALESDPSVNNPIRRGFFVNTSILCQRLPFPPEFVEPIPPAEEGMTTRDRIDRATGDGTCGEGCHSTFINPAGFAFENYGPLGEYRLEERGLPVDATGEYPFAEGMKSYDGGIEFSQVLAESAQAHECYSRHLFEYLYGRYPEHALGDTDLVDAVSEASLAEGAPVRDLVLRLVTAPAFRAIPPDLEALAGPDPAGSTSGASGATATP